MQNYKVKLDSGRVIGPVDLDRIRLLILKNQILGKELARLYPNGEWVKISAIPELAELLLARASGKLVSEVRLRAQETRGTASETHILPEAMLPGATDAQPVSAPEPEKPPEKSPEKPVEKPAIAESESVVEEDKTYVGEAQEPTTVGGIPSEATQASLQLGEEGGRQVAKVELNFPSLARDLSPSVANEETIMIGTKKKKDKWKTADLKEKIKATIAAIALGIAGYQVLLSNDSKPQVPPGPQMVRPVLPNFPPNGVKDPKASQKNYEIGMKAYVLDDVPGYRVAAAHFSKAAEEDPDNVKALALLASSYLNLIDSSNKDENYFAVISKLIDMTRAKNVNLPETVIADVEFFCVVNKAEAAQNRIVEYTRTHPSFGLEMFYYLSLAFYTRGDYQDASRYLSQIPDNKVFSPKVFYFQGLIAEKLGDTDSALIAYGKALKMNPNHAKSRLRIADLLNQRGRIAEARDQLAFLVSHPRLLSPKDLGLTYYLHSVLSEQDKDNETALSDAERAVRLDKDNHDYLLQLYSMRAKGGESIAKLRKDARMYYFLGEGERLLKAGKYQDALTQFLQARQSNNDSPIPLVKIGDMFRYLHDLGNARMNYKMAADRAPNNINIWSKYIDVLIQSYEWDEASKAMDRFRQLPVSQSAIDKAAGDMYAKQGRYDMAQVFYRKAMARESIDPEVYIAYAKALMETHDYKDAPFFFALAERYDPLNIDAVIGTAKCVANTESIDRAISMLQDQLENQTGAKAELLGAIAEFQIQKGDWNQAQKTVDEAMNADPDYAYPWKLQAEIYMNREGNDKKALDKALYAYQSYSERNSSDPSGYLERFRIFVKKGLYDKADDELGKIFGIYPKYPSLHYYKGYLYGLEGNHRRAVEEYRTELTNNPNNVPALIALGKEYVELGGYNEALAEFNKAMQLQPRLPEPKSLAGWANYLLKNYAGAVALYQAALSLDSGNPLLYKRLCLAYRDLGERQKASTACRKYIQMEPDAPDRGEILRYF